MMRIIAIIGESGSGKTRLIVRLLPELKKRGLSVAVIKHCSAGFDIGRKGKDSSRFLAAGAEGVGLISPGRWAVLRNSPPHPSFRALARRVFGDADVVLVEGGRGDRGLKKIEVLGRRPGRKPRSPRRDLAAVVAVKPLAVRVPVFHPDHIDKIAAWLEGGSS